MSILLRILQAVLGITGALQAIQQKQQAILDQLAHILDILEPGPAVGFAFINATTGEIIMAVTLRDDQNVALAIQPVDKKGKPALLDGAPTWASSDETVITVTAAPDGLSAVASAVAPGSARIVVTGDGDLGAGVTAITGTLDVTVTGGGAVSITITPGAVTDQGTEPPPPNPPNPPTP